jgi:hypothetical protein
MTRLTCLARMAARWKALFAALLLAGGIATGLTACDLTLAGGSSTTETGDPVSLSGRVLRSNGEPVSGVVVSLEAAGISDTTDTAGAYLLKGREAFGVSTDTLRFSLNGQLIETQVVSDFEAVLADLQIVQRGFSGALDADAITVTRVEGVVTGDGIAPGDSVSGDFFHNTLAGDYSGFLWFPPPSTGVRNYTVHINVYGAGGTLIGRSADVPFTSMAGNVSIPRFRADNVVAPMSKTP